MTVYRWTVGGIGKEGYGDVGVRLCLGLRTNIWRRPMIFFRRIVIRRLSLIVRIGIWRGWQWDWGWVQKHRWRRYNLGPIELDIIHG